jgi:signal transduction histidine kinase
LHDGLGPQLAALTIKVSAAQNLLASDPRQAGTLLAEIKKESQTAIEEVRNVVDGLRPPALDQYGLLSSLQEFAAQHGQDRPKIIFSAPTQLPPLPAAVEVAAYRIAMEALTNCLRHSQADICTVALAVDHRLQIQISDNGQGLPADVQSGIGLTSMRERAEELGGTFTLLTNENGVTITAVLPL